MSTRQQFVHNFKTSFTTNPQRQKVTRQMANEAFILFKKYLDTKRSGTMPHTTDSGKEGLFTSPGLEVSGAPCLNTVGQEAITSKDLENLLQILKKIVPNQKEEMQLLSDFQNILLEMLLVDIDTKIEQQTMREEKQSVAEQFPKYEKYSAKNHFLLADKMFLDQPELVRKQCFSDLYYKQRQILMKRRFISTVQEKLGEKVQDAQKSLETWKASKIKEGTMFDDCQDWIF